MRQSSSGFHSGMLESIRLPTKSIALGRICDGIPIGRRLAENGISISEITIKSSYLGQISEAGGDIQIECVRSVVGENPGEYWVLIQIVECPSSDCVEEHEIVEVGDLSLLPLERHVAVLEELSGRHEGRFPALWQAVFHSHTHSRQLVDHLLHCVLVSEREHNCS